jgi:hypothetical protein
MVSTIGEGSGRGIRLRTRPATFELTLGRSFFETYLRHRRKSRRRRTIRSAVLAEEVFQASIAMGGDYEIADLISLESDASFLYLSEPLPSAALTSRAGS